MGLLNDLETQLESQIPAQLQAAFQQALDNYRPGCPQCQLAMHRHHRYARAITTKLWRSPPPNPHVPLRSVLAYDQRHGAPGR